MCLQAPVRASWMGWAGLTWEGLGVWKHLQLLGAAHMQDARTLQVSVCCFGICRFDVASAHVAMSGADAQSNAIQLFVVCSRLK